jgi:NADPH-dependent curcumin reductase CurA
VAGILQVEVASGNSVGGLLVVELVGKAYPESGMEEHLLHLGMEALVAYHDLLEVGSFREVEHLVVEGAFPAWEMEGEHL